MRHIADLLVSWGPLGLLLVALAENAGVPAPAGTDVVLLIVAAARPQDAWLCAGLALVGSLIGSAFFFELMHKGGEKVLAKYASRRSTARFHAWALRYGLVTVFVCALVPLPGLPFKFFVACSGAMGVKRSRFLAVLTAARVPRFIGLAYLGATLGQASGAAWLRSHVWYLVALAVFLAAALTLWARRAHRPPGLASGSV